MINGLVKKTIAGFAKICSDKEEPFYFKKDNKKLMKFFEYIVLDYPKEFNHYSKYLEGLIEMGLANLNLTSFFYPTGIDYGFYEVKKEIKKIYNKMSSKEKRLFNKIGNEFYNQFKVNKN